METIEEQSKCEEMSISPTPSPDNLRICLVGSVVNDKQTYDAAQSFGVPVITSENGLDIINDLEWTTYFILNNFDDPIFEAIHKSKHRIMGPPALQQAVQMKEGLIHNNRPVYNYSMRGVITCFTGIRKKDELTRLVNLIHSMGGSIRKDMNSKVTHLICNTSGGEKYQYAMTFRLAVVRSAWVYDAWSKRDHPEFKATCEEFTKAHRLKAFEGQKICFFGFAPDEREHMIDVLKNNGGIPTDLEDPECSHVIMANTGGHFPENIPNSGNSSPIHSSNNLEKNTEENLLEDIDKNTVVTVNCNINENSVINENLEVIGANKIENVKKENVEQEEEKEEKVKQQQKQSIKEEITTPKTHKIKKDTIYSQRNNKIDGIVLNSYEDNEFLNPNNISPILKTPQKSNENDISTISISENISPIDEEDENITDLCDSKDLKRKRDSFDNTSILSNDSIVALDNKNSAKKPKLTRTGSISRSIKRSMSFVAIKTPISYMLRSRRNSIDPNSSISSITSIDTTLNESIRKKPVKEKLKNIRDRITRNNKKDISIVITPKTPNTSISSTTKTKLTTTTTITTSSSSSATLKRISEIHDDDDENYNEKIPITTHTETPQKTNKNNKNVNVIEKTKDLVDFKTPIIPSSTTSSASSTSKSSLSSLNNKKISYRHSVCVSDSNSDGIGVSSINLNTNDINCIRMLPVRKSFISNEKFSTTKKITTTTGNSLHNDNVNVTQQLSSTVTPNVLTTSICTNNMIESKKITNPTITSIDANIMHSNVENFTKITSISDCDVSLCPTIAINDDATETITTGGGDCGNITTAVVDEHFAHAKPEPKNHKTHIVKSDWFWYTIQNGYADEMDYLFGDYLDSIANTPASDRRDSLPVSFNKRKRKRFSQRLQAGECTPLGSGKRRSSVSDAGLLSVSGSFLDCTSSPDKHENGNNANNGKLKTSEQDTSINEQQISTTTSSKNKSMRYNHFMDLYNTESNYVGILDTIVNLFKIPLEEKADTDDALLNKSEVRAIFNNFLPIHEVHRQMLERLRELQIKWYEDCLIGQIILEHRDDLIKAYPPYVNFFEQMKETLIQCDKENPRFHAFLKINQAKPECGRQTLQDLMIRPVQRLPSISLLLNDILKHTNKNSPDHKKLDEALKAIKDVMAHINEDKRKTEGQLAMFDIFNDIEGCPAHLVSSHRSFVSKCEVTELSDSLSGRGDSLMLYLFTDTIEVCKKRSRGFNSAKSPSATKSYKHIKLMPLSSIRFVIDICDSPRAFALNCRHNQDNKDKFYSFIISDEEIDKVIYLRSLCKQMAENACRTDTDKPLLSMTSQELDVDISDVNLSTLSKAFKFATRTRLKVGRAFSFNKTPSKLKRAMSTMMASPFGSTNSLTPASQLAQMRLASCTNINEIDNEDNDNNPHHHNRNHQTPSSQSSKNTNDIQLIVPMSVQPTRKAKTSTISMAALRRL